VSQKALVAVCHLRVNHRQIEPLTAQHVERVASVIRLVHDVAAVFQQRGKLIHAVGVALGDQDSQGIGIR